ncbi:aldo/keto reductase [Alteromonas aestuariivivens]|uniref:Aldo/keto reductase n=1 Tax=Alteromonas aestuariivivens TaxID=1938339 RepID=A0A3D8M314_9ALTE|nr:aldo/keto reductase [Alteromonas aestuariivivens]RDV24079.1 aldo/keto reductase [Alteromonas aestuariivivens]
MKYTVLGNSGLSVSRACLGTMTWGIQNTQQDADQQLDYAISKGVNFIDTAEMYPIPPNAETCGDTERILGNWLARHSSRRSELVIMTKIAGSGLPYIRQGGVITGSAVIEALENSLKRLHTDYIDVYQLHWPNRTSPHFGKHWPGHVDPTRQDTESEVAGMRDILGGIGQALESGKIRHWGLSDDTPWGIHTYLRLCEEMSIPRPVSIQNEFNLLHTKDWPYLIEVCEFEKVAYLPWSPLATGLLSGKYLNDARPEGSRWTLSQRQGLFRNTPVAHAATKEYVDLASQVGLSPAQLALAWCDQVPGVTSTIIGATSLAQLEENIGAFELQLDGEVLSKIEQVLHRYPAGF